MADLTAVAGGTFEIPLKAAAGLTTVAYKITDTPLGTVVRDWTDTGWTESALADGNALYVNQATADPAWSGTYAVEVTDGADSGVYSLTVTATDSTAPGLPGTTWPPPVADVIAVNPLVPMTATQDLVNDVARLVERYTGRTFEAQTGERIAIADGTSYLQIPDARSVSAVSVVDRYGGTWDPAPGYRLAPADRPGDPVRELDLGVRVWAGTTVRVTGDWGWSPAPTLAVRGLAAWVAALLDSDDSNDGPYPVESRTLEGFSETFSVPAQGSEPAGTASGGVAPPPEARRWLDPLRVAFLPVAV